MQVGVRPLSGDLLLTMNFDIYDAYCESLISTYHMEEVTFILYILTHINLGVL